MAASATTVLPEEVGAETSTEWFLWMAAMLATWNGSSLNGNLSVCGKDSAEEDVELMAEMVASGLMILWL